MLEFLKQYKQIYKYWVLFLLKSSLIIFFLKEFSFVKLFYIYITNYYVYILLFFYLTQLKKINSKPIQMLIDSFFLFFFSCVMLSSFETVIRANKLYLLVTKFMLSLFLVFLITFLADKHKFTKSNKKLTLEIIIAYLLTRIAYVFFIFSNIKIPCCSISYHLMIFFIFGATQAILSSMFFAIKLSAIKIESKTLKSESLSLFFNYLIMLESLWYC